MNRAALLLFSENTDSRATATREKRVTRSLLAGDIGHRRALTGALT